MNRKIIGVTVGTPFSPEKIKQKLKPVTSVNGIQADDNGNVEIEGGFGEDGFSPVAKVTQTDNGAVVFITDKNGTTTATVENGKDGKDGQPGADGKDYILTDADKQEIAELASELVDVPTDAHINSLINTALGVIENGTY